VHPENADDASAVLRTLADLDPRVVDERLGVVDLPAPDGPATLAEVLRRLETADVVLSDVGLRRPSLDDVFLALTGHASAPSEPSDRPAPE